MEAYRIATDELAKIRGYIANIARQDLSQPISVGGVFSFDMHSNEWQGYAVNSTPNQSDIIRFAAGEDLLLAAPSITGHGRG